MRRPAGRRATGRDLRGWHPFRTRLVSGRFILAAGRKRGERKEPMMEPRNVPAKPERPRTELHPLAALRREMDRLFDGFFTDAGPAARALAAFNPSADMVENEAEVRITAELPGVEEKDVEVTLANDAVTIKGEKREEKEEKGEPYRLERSYGAFRRTFALPCDVDADKAVATFKNGVLTVALPKSPAAAKTKKIAVKPA
ncbi:MAG: Hsp20/alpha crystallin family protein [Deltaproteobacteria bacterium]|nr:Hsp20/alpha crystallin family protein [Deltaproteobacteria bacterium]